MQHGAPFIGNNILPMRRLSYRSVRRAPPAFRHLSEQQFHAFQRARHLRSPAKRAGHNAARSFVGTSDFLRIFRHGTFPRLRQCSTHKKRQTLLAKVCRSKSLNSQSLIMPPRKLSYFRLSAGGDGINRRGVCIISLRCNPLGSASSTAARCYRCEAIVSASSAAADGSFAAFTDQNKIREWR